MADRTYTAHSKRDANGQVYLNDARLVLGDGSSIQFTNGVATGIPEAQARIIEGRSDLVLIPDDVPPTGVAVDEPDDDVSPPPEQPTPPTNEPQQSAPQPEVTGTEAPELTPEQQEQIDLAKEHLAAEGEEVPEPVESSATGEQPGASGSTEPTEPTESTTSTADAPVPLPDGFVAFTAEGEHRCLARKGDGSQCHNAASEPDGWACGMAAHRKQVDELLAAAS